MVERRASRKAGTALGGVWRARSRARNSVVASGPKGISRPRCQITFQHQELRKTWARIPWADPLSCFEMTISTQIQWLGVVHCMLIRVSTHETDRPPPCSKAIRGLCHVRRLLSIGGWPSLRNFSPGRAGVEKPSLPRPQMKRPRDHLLRHPGPAAIIFAAGMSGPMVVPLRDIEVVTVSITRTVVTVSGTGDRPLQ